MITEEFNEKGAEGEAYVNQLAFQTYLKYWCYPNPIDITGDNKEICDLLILFRDIAILISIKNCDNGGILDRYNTKVVAKSSKQLAGAYRKLFKNNREIKIKHPDREAEAFDPKLYNYIFRITINVGEQFDEYSLSDEEYGKGFSNIINKDTFEAIIEELDTLNDLRDYLIKREALLNEGFKPDAGWLEKDLLALYVQNNREFPLTVNDQGEKQIDGSADAWESFRKSGSFEFRKTQDSSSYFIDEMVEKEVLPLPDGEILARELMNTSRFERRMLAKNLISLVKDNQGRTVDALVRRYYVHNDIGHLLMYYGPGVPQKDIDMLTKLAAEIYSYKKGQKEVVVIAATDNLMQYKFGMFKGFDNPTKEAQTRLEKLINDLGWFMNERELGFRETEFPEFKNS